jgi:2-C-methyl-D-erythritol 4-phosphate cytidylyltransferase
VSAAAVIVAAGAGLRMGAGAPKALLPLVGRPLVAWSAEVLAACPGVGPLVIVAPPGREHALAAASGLGPRLHAVVAGGATRARSVAAGLAALPPEVPRVLVHDAARPLLDEATVARVLAALDDADGAIAAEPVTDTLKREDPAGLVAATVPRAGLWRAQTPQGFRSGALRAAIAACAPDDLDASTDCAALLERAGARVRLVPGAPSNLKVTTPGDLELAELLLRRAGRA